MLMRAPQSKLSSGTAASARCRDGAGRRPPDGSARCAYREISRPKASSPGHLHQVLHQEALGAADIEHAIAGLEAEMGDDVARHREPAAVVAVAAVAVSRGPSKYSRRTGARSRRLAACAGCARRGCAWCAAISPAGRSQPWASALMPASVAATPSASGVKRKLGKRAQQIGDVEMAVRGRIRAARAARSRRPARAGGDPFRDLAEDVATCRSRR